MEACNMKIGIAISTHNRYECFRRNYDEIVRLSDGVKIVVVDDASAVPCPEATFRFESRQGIAKVKNKCLELLDDCDHIFLFDDDIRPVKIGWWKQYVESKEPHLMYIFKEFSTGRYLNDTIELWRNDEIVAWSHARGPMLYFKRICLEKVGGMNEEYGIWGMEHATLSNRIFNVGLSSYRYADVIDSHLLFYCEDEHETVITTVKGIERTACIQRNRPIYESKKFSTEYVPYRPDPRKNIVITTYFTGVPDPQRKACWTWDAETLMPLMRSVDKHVGELTIIHDFKDLKNCAGGVKYVYVHATHNPYFQRWISIREYLRANREQIGKVFCVDATDVEMLKNPFPHMDTYSLYTGDEPEVVGCPWIRNHHQHVKLQEFYRTHAQKPLLNAGLLGGSVDVVIDFLTRLIDFYFFSEIDTHYHKRPNCGMTDMATFNYIAYMYFPDRLSHGAHVNTKFKAYEKNNTTAWFSHK